ncbi:L-seryl-tRNA(Sec) kinase [Drosophila sechellia]|uniref:GM22728 n=1 Tax=Drosophila sechellia TaxID=7238 RepID=B4I781_DROSE|nr:L-seryl-tRNA(Sec) kinase [Drosophila sechellia]EDW56179.1 GM22728 [Drosophila sechellia]
MRRICLVALIGLPAAGKSSLCSWLLDQQTALRVRHIVHLCYDDFLDATPSADLAYKEQRGRIFELIEKLISAIQEDADWPPQVRRISSSGDYNRGRHLILCDDNFYYRSMRYKLYQLCRDSGCSFGQIYMASSLDSCLQANSLRSDATRVPVDVVRQMNERLEVPDTSEAWERNSLTLNGLDMDTTGSALLAFIATLLDLPAKETTSDLPPAAARGLRQDQSLVHRLDLLLRTRIGALLERLTQEEDKRLAGQTLNSRRKEILTKFRTEVSGKQIDGEGEGDALDYYVNLLN